MNFWIATCWAWNRSRRISSFDIAAEWRGILSRLIDIIPKVDADGEIISEDVPFSSDALDRLYQWQNEQTDRCNADGSDTLTSIALYPAGILYVA